MSREDHDHMGTAELVAGTRMQEQSADWGSTPQSPDQPMRDEPMRQQQMRPEPMRPEPTHAQQGGQPMGQQAEQLAALFPPDLAARYRQHWDEVQIGFVDDPQQAVRQADELVAEVMKNLASSFAEQRARLEAGLRGGDQPGHTEQLRMALRSYRSFFQRLLSL